MRTPVNPSTANDATNTGTNPSQYLRINFLEGLPIAGFVPYTTLRFVGELRAGPQRNGEILARADLARKSRMSQLGLEVRFSRILGRC